MALGNLGLNRPTGHTTRSLIGTPAPKGKDEIKATFRIDSGTWLLFCDICKNNHTTASNALRQFINETISTINE